MNVATLKASLQLDDRDFQRGLNAADARLRQTGANVDRAGESVKKFGTRLRETGEALRGIGSALTIGVTAPLLALGKQAVQTSMNLDSLKKGLGAVTKESGTLSQQLSRLREMSRLPGLGFEDAIRGSIRLQAAGLSASQAEKSIREFSNAITLVGGTSEDLNRVSLAMSQVQSAGKLMGDELRQLQEPLPQIRQALIDAFKTADTEVLAKANISADDFIRAVTESFAKLPRAVETPKVQFEKSMQEIRLALGEVGDAITPLVTDFNKWLVPAIKEGVAWFKNLDQPGKNAAIAIGLVAAAAGPLILAFGGVIATWANLTRIIEFNTAALGRNAVAAGVNAKAHGVAAGVNTVATGVGTATGWSSTATTVGTTAATTAAAKGGFWNTVKGVGGRALGGIRAMGVGGVLGRLGIAGAVGTAAFVGGKFIGDSLGIGGLGEGINPAKDIGPLPADAGKTGSALRKRNIIKRIAAQQGISEEEAKKQFEGAVKTGVEGKPASAAVTPDSQFKKDVFNTPEAKAAAREAELEARQAESEAKAGAAGSDKNARAAFKEVAPIIRERIQDLLLQEKALEADAKNNAVKMKELMELRKDRFQLQGDLANLERAANDELKQQQDKEKAEAKRRLAEAKRQQEDMLRARELAFDASVAMTRANLGPEREGRVQREAQQVIPMLNARAKELEQMAAQLLPQIKGNAELTEQYYEWLNQAATLKQEAGNLESRALGEQQEIAKRTEREAKKRAEEQKKAFEDAQDVMGLRSRLLKEQLENNPFLSKQQRGEMMISTLREQFRALSTGAPGETEKEKMQRLLERENVRGDIVESLGAKGKGATTKVLGGGILPFGFDPRRLQGEMAALDKISRETAGGSALGQPIDVKIDVSASPLNAAMVQQVMQVPGFREALERLIFDFMYRQATGASMRRVNP